MTSTQKRWLMIGLAVVVIIAAYIAFFAKPKDNSPYVPLFAYELSSQQQTEVETYLNKNEYEYKSEATKGIQVHESQKESILVELAKQAIPSVK